VLVLAHISAEVQVAKQSDDSTTRQSRKRVRTEKKKNLFLVLVKQQYGDTSRDVCLRLPSARSKCTVGCRTAGDSIYEPRPSVPLQASSRRVKGHHVDVNLK
jgi:hypothetical protein